MVHRISFPLLAAVLLGTVACSRPPPDTAFTQVDGADHARGQRLLAQYQCGRCHLIPDVPAADGASAPSLAAWGRRSYIAGRLQNDPQNLQRWLQSPRAAWPGATMPDLGVTPDDARDMAAHLLSRR
jgi:cytochrome c